MNELIEMLRSAYQIAERKGAETSWEAFGKRIDRLLKLHHDAPRIVCLCGSTRFWKEFQRASLRETMEGRIVLSIGAASGTDDEHFGNLPREEYERVKEMLDGLHKRKIEIADEVLILNVGGYVGQSTQSELNYARSIDKPVRWLEPPQGEATKESIA